MPQDDVQAIKLRVALTVTGLRAQRAWSVEELARQAGLALLTVAQVEDASDPMAVDTLAQLARALDVDVSDLLRDRSTSSH